MTVKGNCGFAGTVILTVVFLPYLCAECINGTWGLDCNHKCSAHCLYGDLSCNTTNGHCLDGCTTGYSPPLCKDCAFNYYGPNCMHKCAAHCRGGFNSCDKMTGECKIGCKPGFLAPYCSTACPIFTYGLGCLGRCSFHCKNAQNPCKSEDGSCAFGCQPGYRNPQCNETCVSGTYGSDCSEKCSEHCKGGRVCDHTNGFCSAGCDKNYFGPRCLIMMKSTPSLAMSILNFHENYVVVSEVATICLTVIVAGFLFAKMHQPQKIEGRNPLTNENKRRDVMGRLTMVSGGERSTLGSAEPGLPSPTELPNSDVVK